MAEMFTIDFIFLLLCLFSLLCYFLLFKKPNSVSDLPPSPPSIPIIGHIHLLTSTLLHKSCQKISSKYGPLLFLHFFNFPILLVSSASVYHEIYKTHDVNTSSRVTSAIEESLIFGSYSFIATPYGNYWKFMKKLVVTKLLGSQALDQSRSIRDDEFQRFYRDLVAKSKNNEKIEIRKEATNLTNNIFCKMIIGRTYSDEHDESEIVKGLVKEANGLAKNILLAAMLQNRLEKIGVSLFKRKIMDVSNRFDELLERILKEHEEREEGEGEEREDKKMKNMMEVLLEAYKDENAEFKLTRNHIKSFFVDIFIGGTDTSVHSIEWTMAELINNPICLHKLKQEIYSIVGKSRLLQETDLPNLPYLQAVIKESLRLHPLSPTLIRRFQEKCKVGRFNIPEKTTLMINAYAIMRDPQVWEDPEEFKPERFLGKDEKIREQVGLKYVPFGAGRRGCPGTNLGYIFVEMAIGLMVQCFDWRIEGEKKKKKKVVSMEECASGGNVIMASPLKCICVPCIDRF